MQETRKLMVELISDEYMQVSTEELAVRYQEAEYQNPQILATVFERLYRLVLKISSRYWGLTSEDIASFSLETLDKALLSYKEGSSFNTYFYTVLKNKLREETLSLSCDKRKANNYTSSLEEVTEKVKIDTIVEIVSDNNLTEKERKYCQLAIAFTNAEIAEKLETTKMTISTIRKNLREKLSYAL